MRCLDVSDPVAKPSALRALGDYLLRLEEKLRLEFIDPCKDTVHCGRAAIPFSVDMETLTEDLRRFQKAFEDKVDCRSKCRVDDVLLRRYGKEVQAYVTSAGTLKKTKDNKGFIKIGANLGDVVTRGPSACTCDRCERIGDAVIALDAPRAFQLEHLDRSFNHLCPPIKQPHRHHASEIEFFKNPQPATSAPPAAPTQLATSTQPGTPTQPGTSAEQEPTDT